MLESLKQAVYEANLLLPRYKLVAFTWGNASGVDREAGLVVIKPSGVDYADLTSDNMVVLDLDGNIIEGNLRPSTDAPTHIELYKRFKNIGGVVHTHSRWATIFAQQKQPIKPLGTTHADYFYGAIPCTRPLYDSEINGDYERETGAVIADCHPDPDGIPAVLVANHGPFTWGKDVFEAAFHSAVLEEVAFMAWHNDNAEAISQSILDRHYLRKHGKNAYYGQS